MPLVTDRSQDVANWVASQYGGDAPSVDAAIGYADDTGQLTAGVFFDGATDNNVFAHIASVGPLPISLTRAVARFVYHQLGMERMTFFFSEKHTKVQNLVVTMGAAFEARLASAFAGADGLLYVLWRDSPFVRALLR